VAAAALIAYAALIVALWIGVGASHPINPLTQVVLLIASAACPIVAVVVYGRDAPRGRTYSGARGQGDGDATKDPAKIQPLGAGAVAQAIPPAGQHGEPDP